jgi:hypothetical protein
MLRKTMERRVIRAGHPLRDMKEKREIGLEAN